MEKIYIGYENLWQHNVNPGSKLEKGLCHGGRRFESDLPIIALDSKGHTKANNALQQFYGFTIR